MYANIVGMCKTFFEIDCCLTSKKKVTGKIDSLLGGEVTSQNLFRQDFFNVGLFLVAMRYDRLGSVQKQNYNIILFCCN